LVRGACSANCQHGCARSQDETDPQQTGPRQVVTEVNAPTKAEGEADQAANREPAGPAPSDPHCAAKKCLQEPFAHDLNQYLDDELDQ
jgi:hypothetical protein